jgi:outer membrane protein TolC
VYESALGQAVGALFNQPNTYTFNTNLTQTVFQGGRLIAGIRAGNDVRQSAREDEREQRATVTMQVQRAYLQGLFTARIAELQDSNLTVASNRVTQLEQLQRAGQAARYDVLRVRVERSNLEPLAIAARNDRELALLDLKRLLNVPVDQPLARVTHIDSASAA